MIWLVAGVRIALFTALLLWLYYIALEPNVRRFWPQSLVSWSRVLTGGWRDPVVGRDVLVGVAYGTVVYLVLLVNGWIGLHSVNHCAALVAPALDWELGRLAGFQFTASSLAGAFLHGLGRGLLVVALMLLVRIVVRRRWETALVFGGLLAASYILGSRPVGPVAWLACVLLAAGTTLVLDRAGFLAFVVSLFVSRLLVITPMTVNLQAWYGGQSLFVVLVVVLLIAAGLYASRPPRSAFQVAEP
jgi:serine/threonine-protein kinase